MSRTYCGFKEDGSHGQRSLAGCSPSGPQRVGHDWVTACHGRRILFSELRTSPSLLEVLAAPSSIPFWEHPWTTRHCLPSSLCLLPRRGPWPLIGCQRTISWEPLTSTWENSGHPSRKAPHQVGRTSVVTTSSGCRLLSCFKTLNVPQKFMFSWNRTVACYLQMGSLQTGWSEGSEMRSSWTRVALNPGTGSL